MLIPYFGRWPEWMSLYLYTCSRNPMVDFHFFTDCGVPQVTYANTIFHETSFDEYLIRVKDTVGIVLPMRGDKLPDLKPLYGRIHADLIREHGYQWWGFGDLDVAYGDLSALLSVIKDCRIELITTHIYQISGHFCLIKSGSKDYDDYHPSPEITKIIEGPWPGFTDEVHYSQEIRPKRLKLIDRLWFAIGLRLRWERNSFYTWMDRLLPGKRLNAYYCDPSTTFDPIPGEKYTLDLSTLRWSMGKGHFQGCIRPRPNMPYLHFLKFKKCTNNRTGLHWPNGYYQIPESHIWQGDEKVEITLEHVRLV